MIEATPVLTSIGMFIFMVLVTVGMCFLARKEGMQGERERQARKQADEAAKQKDIANVQTEIATNAPTSRDDAIKRLRQRSKSNR